jgi:hypothetical protein
LRQVGQEPERFDADDDAWRGQLFDRVLDEALRIARVASWTASASALPGGCASSSVVAALTVR